jgi:hypothetical protein
MKKSLFAWAAAATLAGVVPAAAHHSPAAFETQKTVSLVGTIKEFRWQNPHTWIEIMVPDASGKEVLWAVELTSPTYLVRAGWKSTTLKPGDKVTVVGRPLKSGEPGSAIFTSVTLADGTTLRERPARLGGDAAAGREGGAGRGK